MIHEASYEFQTAGEIIASYTLTFMFVDGRWEDTRFCTDYWRGVHSSIVS
jgi:hypothetical protein